MSANLVQGQLFFTQNLVRLFRGRLKTDIGDIIIECYLDDSLNSVEPHLPSTCIEFF